MADGSRIAKPRLVPVLVTDLVRLAYEMRDDEKDQWCAVTGNAEYDPDLAGRMFAQIGGVSWCYVNAAGEPVAAGGFEEVRPKVWQTWMAGTMEAWTDHWKAITRHSKRLGDRLIENGHANRIQTYALAERTAAHRWYEALGQRYESHLEQFFADGRDAVCYVKTGAR
jgi:hypothetical protein